MTLTEAPAQPVGVADPTPVRRGCGRRLITAAVVTAVVWTGIVLGRLFVGGAIGMGDQGDGRRLMCQLGVRNDAPFDANPSAFLYPTYVPHTWYGEACSADSAGGIYRTSEIALLALAKALTPVLGLPGALDLRALGVIFAVLTGLCVGALVLALPGGLAVRVGVASLVGLLAADSAVAQYFISPYSEAAGLIALIALCPALLLLWRRGRTTWPTLAAVGFISAVALGAKTQTASLLPALLVAILWLPHRRGGHWLVTRIPGLTLSALLVCLAGYFAATSPVGFAQQNVYGQVFGTILPNSPDPAADLRSLGADPSLADASGTNPESPGAASQRLEYLTFREDVTTVDYVRFYLTHPDRLVSLGGIGLQGVGRWRQDYLGSYLPDSGQQPLAIESRVNVYGSIFQDAFPPVLVLFWLGMIYIGIRTARDRRLSTPEQNLGRLSVFLAAGSFSQFWTVLIFAGFPDLYKHLIFTNLLLGLGVPIMVACVAVRSRAFRQRARA